MELAPEVNTGKKAKEVTKGEVRSDYRIPLHVIAKQPLFFTVGTTPQHLNQTLLNLQCPKVSGMIPLFKVTQINQVEIYSEAKKVNESSFQIVMQTTYGVFDPTFAAYREWLMKEMGVDLNDHLQAFSQ